MAALVYSPLIKRAMWHLGQGAALKSATALHATSEEEVGHIRAQGLRQPIILSNGIDILASHAPRGPRLPFYTWDGCIKKGLDMLLTAWEAVEPDYLDWDLRIIGKGSHSFEAGLAPEIWSWPEPSDSRQSGVW